MTYLLLYDLVTGSIVGASIGADEETEAPEGYAYLAVTQEEWVYAESVDPAESAAVLSDSPQRTDPSMAPADARTILQDTGNYRANRREAYDPVGEQLDRLTAALEYLADQGIDIGREGREQVTRVRSVKRRFPKPDLPTL